MCSSDLSGVQAGGVVAVRLDGGKQRAAGCGDVGRPATDLVAEPFHLAARSDHILRIDDKEGTCRPMRPVSKRCSVVAQEDRRQFRPVAPQMFQQHELVARNFGGWNWGIVFRDSYR